MFIGCDKEPNLKRFFLLAFRTNINEGNAHFITNYGFINSNETKALIKASNENITDVAITFIMEVTENDYNDFIK